MRDRGQWADLVGGGPAVDESLQHVVGVDREEERRGDDIPGEGADTSGEDVRQGGGGGNQPRGQIPGVVSEMDDAALDDGHDRRQVGDAQLLDEVAVSRGIHRPDSIA